MGIRPRNWLHETKKQELERRVIALEEHIKDTEQRFADVQNAINVQLGYCPEIAAHIAKQWEIKDA